MKDQNKTKKQLISELHGLRKKVADGGKSVNPAANNKLLQSPEQMRVNAHRLSTLIAHLPGGIIIETPERKVLQVNQKFCQLFGVDAPPVTLQGADCQQAAQQSKALFIDEDGFIKHIDEILEAGKAVQNEELLLKDGRVFERDYVPVEIAPGQLEHLWHYRDITERKKAEQALKEAHKTLLDEHNIFTAGPVVVFKWQNAPGWPVEYVSANVEEVFGYSVEEFMRGAVSYAEIIPEEDIGRVAEEVRSNSESGAQSFHHQPYRIIRRDGRAVWLLDYTIILRDEAGEITHYLGYVVDITERKQAEEKMKAALQEKEVLLKEIHHRVKNNMQIISSLLSLQSKSVINEQVQNYLKDSRNRIRSMALVHEKLYQTENLTRINFADYIRNLTHYLFRSYGADSNAVHLRLEAVETYLDVDKAIPLGLIINELVSNSLKYAFNADRREERKIFIELKKIGQIKESKQAAEACGGKEKCTLIVGDNGAGLPDKVDFRNSESLGLQLVNTLVKQLDGEIELDKREGTSFIITFNV